MKRAATLVAASVLLMSTAASADGGAPYTYSYELESDAPADQIVIVWPRICSASGEPLGKVDLALNPDWATRMNDVDYEVLVPGKHHELPDNCRKTAHLYALGATAFPRGTRPATADDSAIGQHVVGQPFAIVPLLDAIDRKRRIEFFEKDPRVKRTLYQLDAPAPKAAKPLTSMHEVLAFGTSNEAAFVVVQKSATYTYQDGASETVTPAKPEPAVDAGVTGSSSAANPPGNSANSGPLDIGTRWVFLAAVGGLVAGGLIAFYRKKKAS